MPHYCCIIRCWSMWRVWPLLYGGVPRAIRRQSRYRTTNCRHFDRTELVLSLEDCRHITSTQ